MRIIFFGADRWFSGPVLAAILKAGHQAPVVITKGDALGEGRRTKDAMPAGRQEGRRKTRFIQANEEKDISLNSLMYAFDLQPSAFSLARPDVIVLASFGPPFLPAEVLKWPKYGCLNVHASLLPRWRGASPVFAALSAGDKETGVSIMRMTEKIDRGPVLGRRKLKIRIPRLQTIKQPDNQKGGSLKDTPLRILPNAVDADTRETLTKRLGKLGGELIVETLKKLETGQITEVRQPIKSPTPYTRRLTKESGRIDWRFRPGETGPERSRRIERFIRAVTPWPGARTEYKEKGKRLKDKGKTKIMKILKAEIQFLYPSSFILLPSIVQLPGKNPVSWKQFLAGHPGAEFI